jgi:hypothetical protein
MSYDFHLYAHVFQNAGPFFGNAAVGYHRVNIVQMAKVGGFYLVEFGGIRQKEFLIGVLDAGLLYGNLVKINGGKFQLAVYSGGTDKKFCRPGPAYQFNGFRGFKKLGIGMKSAAADNKTFYVFFVQFRKGIHGKTQGADRKIPGYMPGQMLCGGPYVNDDGIVHLNPLRGRLAYPLFFGNVDAFFKIQIVGFINGRPVNQGYDIILPQPFQIPADGHLRNRKFPRQIPDGRPVSFA